MKTIFSYLFPKKSKWHDIGIYDKFGEYLLIQLRCGLDNNKKEFRTVSMGFVNDHVIKQDLFKAVLSVNSGLIENKE